MEYRHTRLKAFANLMEREYWIHAVLPKRCASVAELPGGSKEEPVRLLHNSTNQGCGHIFGGCAELHFEQGRNEKKSFALGSFLLTTRMLCCRFFRCQQVAPARVMQGAGLVLRSSI